MNDIAVFAFGSVVFIITVWATFSFGLRRMGELQARELASQNLRAVPRDSGLTEVHLPGKTPPKKPGSAS